MAELNLPQCEADALLNMEKHRLDDHPFVFPVHGSLAIPLTSSDQREQFLLDISRGYINLEKIKYQNRARQVIILARLDLFGSPHRNPDDEEISCPHLHVYREGYADKWAMVPPSEFFGRLDNPQATFSDFMGFCHITKPPIFTMGLWS